MADMNEESAKRSSWKPVDLSPYLTEEWSIPYNAGFTNGFVEGVITARASLAHALKESERIRDPGMYGNEGDWTGVEDPVERGYHTGLRHALKVIDDYQNVLKAARKARRSEDG